MILFSNYDKTLFGALTTTITFNMIKIVHHTKKGQMTNRTQCARLRGKSDIYGSATLLASKNRIIFFRKWYDTSYYICNTHYLLH